MCKGATGVTKKKLPPVPREVARKYAVQRRARVDAISGSEPVSEKDDPLLHHPLLASIKGLLRAKFGGAGETVAKAIDSAVLVVDGMPCKVKGAHGI